MLLTFSKAHTNNYLWLVLFSVCVLLLSCQENKRSPQAAEVVARDTSITVQNAYSDLFFDSTALAAAITARQFPDTVSTQLHNFYNGRNYQFAWFTRGGLTEQARIFWSLQSDYLHYSRDSALYNPQLQLLMDSAAASGDTLRLADSTRLAAELQLTRQFARYAHRAYQGNIPLGESDLGWFIPRKQINTRALLDSFLKTKEPVAPVNAQYGLLKKFLGLYYGVQQKGGWPAINSNVEKFSLGDSLPAIAAIKTRLRSTGDYTGPDTSYQFTAMLEAAVKHFQKRTGLTPDGVIGGNTLAALNVDVEERIRKILLNMERMRWMPATPADDYILVNIPQYKLTAFENGARAFAMNIVVGKEQHETVIFTGELKNVVFSPYWNVPQSIIHNEILPAMRRSANYLARHNMEWNGGYVRQKPGPDNALGKVKFLFPNSYAIYLHDTPAKSLFSSQRRAFSHGCIRVGQPEKLANWVLRKQPAWTPEKIDSAMNAGKQTYVPVNATIPVFIGYFTAFVDADGQLNFRDDIYGHDAALAAHLFAH